MRRFAGCSALAALLLLGSGTAGAENKSIKVGTALARPVSLEQIKANKLFAESPLVRIGRLSVVPLTKPQYKALTGE